MATNCCPNESDLRVDIQRHDNLFELTSLRTISCQKLSLVLVLLSLAGVALVGYVLADGTWSAVYLPIGFSTTSPGADSFYRQSPEGDTGQDSLLPQNMPGGADVKSPRPVRLCTQEERLHHLREVCRKYSGSRDQQPRPLPGNILADDNHDVIYCWISKVGCTAFKSLFLRAAGYKGRLSVYNVHNKTLLQSQNVPTFFTLRTQAKRRRMKKYFKFMNIRHPLERLVSVFTDKVLGNGSDYPGWILSILQIYHPGVFKDPSLDVKKVGLARAAKRAKDKYKPSFEDFVDWLANKMHLFYNRHWETALSACQPCGIDYDAILRIETMDSDSDVLLDLIGQDLSHNESIPIVHSHQHGQHNTSYYQHTVKRLAQYEKVPQKTVAKFLQYYQRDMEMFGYHWDQDTLTASCSIPTPQGPCC